MQKKGLFDKGKRMLKNSIPFLLRHKIQLFYSNHPDNKVLELFRQDVILEDYQNGFFSFLRNMGEYDFEGKYVCELGPGGSVENAFYLYQMGAIETWLLDVTDLAHSEKLVTEEDYKGFVLPQGYEIKKELPMYFGLQNVREYLKRVNAFYLVDGLDSYKKVPSETIDIMFSCSVLQHIRKNIFVDSLNEMNRMMKSGGIAFHTVDLRDMMGGGKNHLRYTDDYWNNKEHRNMRCYTNRIQCSEMCELFSKAGFVIEKLDKSYFKKSPIKKKLLADTYRELSEKELLTETFLVILRKA